jgi:hypothetical protein
MGSRTSVLAALLLASSVGCISGRLDVDITTVIQADGSCTRRTVYTYAEERSPKPGADPAAPMSADSDPLRRLHRFPTDERWTIQHDVRAASHSVVMEGRFKSPNDIDWDYWRTATPKARPARNHFSFALDQQGETSQYEYSETFLDPASPVEWLRQLAQLLSQREKPLAQALHRELGDRAIAVGDLRRALHDEVVGPLTVEVARLSARPVFGPRERHEAEAVLESDDLTKGLIERLISLSPGLGEATAKAAIDAAYEAAVSEEDLDAATGAAIFAPDTAIRIHATLTMPAPIVRANTCFQGDTATWDFEGADLYGRGFEMSAVASTE